MNLHGAIDTHVHSFPDVVPRKLDDVALVEQARAAGMRGVLLKSHVFSTAERAYLLRRMFPGFEAFGGIVLNHTVGGLNPRAVEAALALGAVQVWMPTLSAANHHAHLGGDGTLSVLSGTQLRSEARDILRLIAAAGAVLATGHLSPHESEVLIDTALECGVRAVNVTHPEWPVTAIPLAVQQRFAATGRVFLERCLVATQPGAPARISTSTLVEQIRETDLAVNLITTDFGMPQYPTPVEGLRMFFALLLDAGFAERDVRRMACDNPARLLRLAPPGGDV